VDILPSLLPPARSLDNPLGLSLPAEWDLLDMACHPFSLRTLRLGCLATLEPRPKILPIVLPYPLERDLSDPQD